MTFAHAWIEIANDDCMVQTKEIRVWIHFLQVFSTWDCAVEAGKQRSIFEPVIDSDLS